ncbi:unnamed protein product, partial [Mesorhabditis spiculigera]
MRPPDLWRLWLKLAALLTYGATLDKTNIEDCATVLGENLLETFNRATRSQHIPEYYDGYVEVEQYDPRIELKKAKQHIEKYLARRAKFAYDAKLSLEARPLLEGTDLEVNNPDSKNFIRYMSAKSGGDGGILYRHDHSFNNRISLNATRNFSMHANANFYFLSTSSIASAVHIPTPIYDRDPELLNKIHWSDIDQVYRSNREGTRDLAFQLFCSESGFMRYFPAAPWYWDHETDRDVLDLFDCRNSEWYINGATCSKNVLIMLDMSGSMLGQRYEIAKQTTEAILETLSHNDYFNILPFAANPQFLDEECSKQHPMLQATMRNKKYLRALMNNITSEGKAEYDAAIEKAFATLKGLPRDIEWMHKDEVEQSGRNFSLEGKHTIEFPERLLIVTDEYMKALGNTEGITSEYGCESVLALITDGAPEDYHEIFQRYNPKGEIRVFTFLIGEEAIDFEQVRNMACQNRGYMVHIQNMADVEEKIQNYIRVMSRPLGAHDKDIDEKSQVWSGVYRERLYLPRRERFADPAPLTNQSFAQMNRMAAKRKIHMKKAEARSRMFVTTVSYPVLLNKTFMGVAAVNIPLTELGQLAHPTEIGGNSYYFMLDYNGFIMFHPQLRPIDMRTKLHKQNYNNMELLELEVGQNGMAFDFHETRPNHPTHHEPRGHCHEGSTYADCVRQFRHHMHNVVLNCDNSKPPTLDVLFASDMVDRVYPQTNTYYSECIKDSDFVLGLAVSKGDESRIARRNQNYDYGKVQLSWAEEGHWHIHPYWRYCLLNDTDAGISKEEAFVVYMKQMKKSGKLPELCRARQALVDRLILDLEATAPIYSQWQEQYNFMNENLIHLTFFATQSGLIRYYNYTLESFLYNEKNYDMFNVIQMTEGKQLREDEVRFQESYQHFITEINRKSVEDRYFRRSIRQKDKIVFDINNSSKLWYPMGETKSAYGILENVTLLGQATKAIYKEDALLGVAGLEFVMDWLVNTMTNHGCPPSDWQHWCVLLDEHGYVVYSNDAATSYKNAYMDLRGGESHLGVFFAHINRVAERAMELLVHRGFYKKYMYYDHQATCLKPKPVTQSGYSLRRPITSIIAYFMRFVNKLLLSAKQLSLFPFFHQFINTAEAFTASFHTAHDGFPCTKETPFYYQQPDDETRSGDLVDGGRAEKPCINTKCAVRMQAHSVPNTNLIMVWITQTKDSMHCYESAHCPLNYPSPVPFIWKSTEHNTTESKCRHDATVMLFITLALGVVVEEVNLHKRIALKMLCCTGTRPNRLLFGFMLITGFMSFFLTDYAATALMLPFAHAVLEAKQHGKQSLVRMGVLPKMEITFFDWAVFAIPPMCLYMIASYLVLLVCFMGPMELFGFWRKTKRQERVEQEHIRLVLRGCYQDLGKVSWAEKWVMFWVGALTLAWLTRDLGFINLGWGPLLFSEDHYDYMTDATPGIIVLYLMFVWPRYNPWDVRTRTKGEGPEKLLTWPMLQHKLAWSLLFLVGCGFAISTAVKESGLSSQIEDLLKEELSGLDPLLLQLICLLIVVVLTEFVSNSSTASIFVPLFLGAAQSLKMHPYYLGIPAAIGPSLAFMLPMATPPNALVFETGEITFWEMVYSGGLLSVFCVGATMLNMNTWAYWWFNMDEHKWLERAPGNTTLQMPPTPSAHAMSLNGIE